MRELQPNLNMIAAVSIWPREEAEWVELILDSFAGVKTCFFPDLGIQLEHLLSLQLLIVDADYPGPQFFDQYTALLKSGGTLPMVVLGSAEHPLMQQIEWKKNATLFIPKPYSSAQLEKGLALMVEKLSAYLERKTLQRKKPENAKIQVNAKRTVQATGTGLSSLDPKDILQMLCLSQWNGRMDIYCEQSNEKGSLFLKFGQIVHATSAGEEGLEALFCLLASERGSYHFAEGDESLLETIQQPWESLLLEASRQKDERDALGRY